MYKVGWVPQLFKIKVKEVKEQGINFKSNKVKKLGSLTSAPGVLINTNN
jgi:hypothetical protein